jgi:hypothetical protein
MSTHIGNHNSGDGTKEYGGPSDEVEESDGFCKNLPWKNRPTPNERTQDLPSTNIEPLESGKSAKALSLAETWRVHGA